MPVKLRTVPHFFSAGHTIDAAIKLYHPRALTPAEIEILRREFNKVNDAPLVRPYQTYQIPILEDEKTAS